MLTLAVSLALATAPDKLDVAFLVSTLADGRYLVLWSGTDIVSGPTKWRVDPATLRLRYQRVDIAGAEQAIAPIATRPVAGVYQDHANPRVTGGQTTATIVYQPIALAPGSYRFTTDLVRGVHFADGRAVEGRTSEYLIVPSNALARKTQVVAIAAELTGKKAVVTKTITLRAQLSAIPAGTTVTIDKVELVTAVFRGLPSALGDVSWSRAGSTLPDGQFTAIVDCPFFTLHMPDDTYRLFSFRAPSLVSQYLHVEPAP